jgi:hypothetical protein
VKDANRKLNKMLKKREDSNRAGIINKAYDKFNNNQVLSGKDLER